jgi:hypothetical protein
MVMVVSPLVLVILTPTIGTAVLKSTLYSNPVLPPDAPELITILLTSIPDFSCRSPHVRNLALFKLIVMYLIKMLFEVPLGIGLRQFQDKVMFYRILDFVMLIQMMRVVRQ